MYFNGGLPASVSREHKVGGTERLPPETDIQGAVSGRNVTAVKHLVKLSIPNSVLGAMSQKKNNNNTEIKRKISMNT